MSDIAKAKCLRERLVSIPTDRLLVITPYSELRYGELGGRDGAYLRSAFLGKAVALATDDLLRVIHSLVALDGAASSVLLCSIGLDAESQKRLLHASGCVLVVSDRCEHFADAGVPCYEYSLVLRSSDANVGMVQVDRATDWLLTTSGTTGTPKIVSHTLCSLTRTVKADLVFGESVRWGLLYDFTRFAGLQVVLQSLLAGSALIAPDLSQPLQDQLTFLSKHKCTHLSATPTMWRKILMTPASCELTLNQVTLGGEIADQRLLTVLRTRFPKARITHIYASTEAGVGFSVNDGVEGFPVSFLASPPAGIQLKVSGGRLFVRGQDVRATYAYVGSDEVFSDDEGYIDTGDGVELRDGRYRFLGRLNGAINVGGNRVFPERVEQVLLSVEGVKCARVYGRANPITGQIVAAEVVPADASHLTVDELRERTRTHCVRHLSRIEVPVSIAIVSEISVSVAGKIARGIA
jgi:acyl-coenzyme A synthetase/AMP-(fatty) acid ligase